MTNINPEKIEIVKKMEERNLDPSAISLLDKVKKRRKGMGRSLRAVWRK
jgi:hypothetical protein